MDVKELTERIQARLDGLKGEESVLVAEWYRLHNLEDDSLYVKRDGDPWAWEVSKSMDPLKPIIRDLETSLRVIEEMSR